MISERLCLFRMAGNFEIAETSFVGTVSTCSRCPRENLRQLLGELVARLSLKSVLRFCIGHQEGPGTGLASAYKHTS